MRGPVVVDLGAGLEINLNHVMGVQKLMRYKPVKGKRKLPGIPEPEEGTMVIIEREEDLSKMEMISVTFDSYFSVPPLQGHQMNTFLLAWHSFDWRGAWQDGDV